MPVHNESPYTRRAFLRSGVTLASAAATAPYFVHNSAAALAQMLSEVSSIPGVPDERVLVVVQLAGGNDGLNTVVPYGQRAYYNARPRIAVPEKDTLRIDQAQGVGLHPRLAGLKALYDDGMLGVVQGVGYPNPDRSHFRSMDIWHTASPQGAHDGWLGRYFDNECGGKPGEAPDPRAGVVIGREAPLAMLGKRVRPVSFESAELLRWSAEAGDADSAIALRKTNEELLGEASREEGSNAAFVARATMDARLAEGAISKALGQTPLAQYPRGALAEQLKMVAMMIRAQMRTKVYYVTMGGFDTHAGQGAAIGRHANLLGQFAGALRAFYNDLKAQGNDGRALTLVFSEFGRRVAQNASGGTDHGAAAPVFLAGPMVRPGVINAHPSMTNLDQGDLKFSLDFRSVYAGILQDWLGADAAKILRGKFRPAKLVRAD